MLAIDGAGLIGSHLMNRVIQKHTEP